MKNHSVVWAMLVVELGVLGGAGARGWADQETHQRVEGGDGQTATAIEAPAASSEAAPDIAAQPKGGAANTAPSTSAVTAPTAPGFISVDFKDADIRQVLRVISLKSGMDIVAGSDVEGLVSVKLTNVPWEQALDIILRTYGFTYERKDNIVRVMTIAALEKEALSTEVFPLDYAKAKDVPDVVKEMLSERGKVKFDERTNTVIVTDIPSSLFRMKQVIGRLDRRTPQTLIETKVVETKLTKSESLGINWSDNLTLTQTIPSVSSTFPFTPGAAFGSLGTVLGTQRAPERPGSTIGLGTLSSTSLSAVLNFLQSRTDTHIVSNPSISALNNQEAKIHIGEEYPIPNYTIDPTTGKTQISGYTAKNIGTVLTVTPHVNPSNEIVVDLKPEVITAADPVSFSTGAGTSVSLPRFTTQTAQTQVRIKNGETIAIGGLVKKTESKTVEKIPLLGDIPVIGLLFRNTQRYSTSDPVRQDLLIFLTVRLMGEEPGDAQKVAAAPPMASSP